MTYQAEKEQRERERERLRIVRENIETIDADIDQACKMVDDVVSQALASSGFHCHRGEWRKKR
jgi:hypothetical protein